MLKSDNVWLVNLHYLEAIEILLLVLFNLRLSFLSTDRPVV